MNASLAMMLLSFVLTNTVTTTILAEMLLSIMLTFTSDACLLYASLAIHDLLLIYHIEYHFKAMFNQTQHIISQRLSKLS